MTFPVELTRPEWSARPARLRQQRLKCECRRQPKWRRRKLAPINEFDVAFNVFRCREERERKLSGEPRFACGHYCCACVGGSDDNRCSSCWAKRQKWLKRLPSERMAELFEVDRAAFEALTEKP